MDAMQSAPTTDAAPKWQPIDTRQRRVLGVLIEKGKTTPNNYPLSLNALTNACNQKSNRFPTMQLEDDDVEEEIEKLRELGAVVVIQGGSRVDKYRHLAYDWLGVDKFEIAVMGELLLRGAQTIGELRGRAARMEPIKDLGELRPVLDRLQQKNLIVYLTPPGRGAVLTHNLYLPQQLKKVQDEYGGQHVSPAGPLPRDDSLPATAPDKDAPMIRPATDGGTPAAPQPSAAQEIQSGVAELQDEVDQLRLALQQVKNEVSVLREEMHAAVTDLREQLNDLNQQLGNL